jgi:hypothetical protein
VPLIVATRAGADIVTVAYHVLERAAKHPLTDKGIETLLKEWEQLRVG